ncbi:hypothetical protein ANO11243_091720 [Dothideomycetidae sp. 11243]|nr:hypothetical protein ANO11243_091720 [fungal sp. No.11243]
MAELKQRQSGTFDPFEDIYATVFQLTMHTVGCNEAASDRAVSDKLLYFFDKVEAAGTPTVIMFPWFPSLAKLQRVIYGGRIYMMFDEFVKTRVAEGRREDDALQHYMDNGDDTLKIIKVNFSHHVPFVNRHADILQLVIGALYAGQVNSGLNAAWVLMFLAANAEWRDACRREVETIATKHDADTSRPLSERLVAVPLTAWESDFPIGEACLRETIRMNSCGTAFRQNLSDQPVQIADGEVIPSGWFATCAMADVHYNPEFYPDPTRWDPSRFLTSATSPHAGNDVPFIGWGTGRHPCSGQRFAKLEQNLIVAFFVAEFGDFELTDMAKGLPQANINAASVQKPSKKSQWITYMSERKV